jgi:hypothetical protein
LTALSFDMHAQGVLGDLLVGTGAEALSDERKWQIRMLLPRDTLKALAQAVPGQAAVPAPAPAVPAPAALPAFAPAPTVAPAAGAAAAPAVPAVSAPACALFGSLLPEQAQHAQTLFQALQLQQARLAAPRASWQCTCRMLCLGTPVSK